MIQETIIQNNQSIALEYPNNKKPNWRIGQNIGSKVTNGNGETIVFAGLAVVFNVTNNGATTNYFVKHIASMNSNTPTEFIP